MSLALDVNLFGIYKEQFDNVMGNAKRVIESVRFVDGEERKQKMKIEIEKSFHEAERIIKQMELDINLSEGVVFCTILNLKTTGNNKKVVLMQCKGIIESVKVIIKKELENLDNKKKEKELTIKFGINKNRNNQEHEQPLLNNSNSNSNSNRNDSENEEIKLNINSSLNFNTSISSKLHIIQRTCIELENVSENIKRDLNNQTDTLRNISNSVNGLNENLNNSNSIVTSMISSGNRNRSLMALFSITMVCMFIFILYSKF